MNSGTFAADHVTVIAGLGKSSGSVTYFSGCFSDALGPGEGVGALDLLDLGLRFAIGSPLGC
jgi:hypothetical protein